MGFALKRRKPPRRKRRGTRRGPWRNEAKRRWIAEQPCLVTGRPAQCCHVTHNGMASKGSDEYTVPLCPEIHDQFEGRAKLPNGEVGKRAFQRYYGLDLVEIAHRMHVEWAGGLLEPPCECVYIAPDVVDARLCDLHNPDSEWNRKRRRLEREAQPEQTGEVDDRDCSF